MLIFTAQSKRYFYKRDHVCQFVMEQGHVPIHPFRVFDWWLHDKVNRQIIRDQIKELIERCDEFWTFGEEVADGVLKEIKLAQSIKKPIKFFTIDYPIKEITFSQLYPEKECKEWINE